MSDVSDQTEKTLDHVQLLWKGVFENASIGISVVDTAGRYIAVNPAYAQMLGYSVDELLNGHSIREVTHPDDRESSMRLFHELLRGQRNSYQHEKRYVRRDGSLMIGVIHASVLRNEQGKPQFLLGMLTDVSAQREAEAARLRAESMHKMLLANLSGMAYRCQNDADWTMNYVSEGCVELLGYQPNDLIGNKTVSFGCLVHADDAGWLATKCTRNLAERKPCSNEYRVITAAGGEKWVWDQAQGVYDENGALVLIEGFISDITARKKAEQALRESEKRYLALAAISPVGILRAKLSGECVYVNRCFCEISGMPAEEALGNGWTRAIHPEDQKAVFSELRTALAEKRDFSLEYRYLHPSGEIRWVLGQAAPEKDAAGEIIGYVGTVTDITPRKRAEDALWRLNEELEERVQKRTFELARLNETLQSEIAERTRAEQKAQDILIALPDLLFELDKDGVFLGYHASKTVSFYVPPELFLGKRVQDVLPPVVSAPILASMRAATETGTLQVFEYDLRMPTGLESFECRLIDAQSAGYLAVVRRITERKHAEAALLRNEEALRKSSEKLSLANRELERSARLKDEFLASMSHELRTPLNAILGLSEALLEQTYGSLSEKQGVAVARIAESGQHLLSLINDILDLSKIEAGKLEIHREVFPVDAVCQASMRLVHEQARKKKLRVSLSMDSSVSLIQADQRRLTQILINLLSNAVKFTPEGGTIGLSVTGDIGRQSVHFTVWDTGIGIPRDELESIFKPFVQLDSSLSRQHQGTGLGLSLVGKLVELHGGGVVVESEPGKGSRFTVSLPWEPEETGGGDALNSPAAQGAPREKVPVLGGRPEKPRILLAEDNEANILTFSDYLRSQGHQVVVATTGFEAVEQSKACEPDLVLMDIQLPGLDGLEAMRRIRAERPDVPIVALTAFVMPGDRERCLSAGAWDYLAKPVGLRELLRAVERHFSEALRRRAAAQNEGGGAKK